jgi:cold shock CspA family protein
MPLKGPYNGTIVHYNMRMGMGYLKPDAHGMTHRLVYNSNVVGEGKARELRKGDRVSFMVDDVSEVARDVRKVAA